MSFRKLVVTALGALAASLISGAAFASTTLTLKSGGLYAPEIVKISGPGMNGSFYASALKLTAVTAEAPGAPFDFWAFCVDLYHSIDVGVGSQKPMNLAYEYAPLVQNGAGVALTTAQQNQIRGLAAYGFDLIRTGDPQLSLKLAAVQTAIWRIEYPTLTFTANKAQVNTFAGQFVALAPTLTGRADTIYAVNRSTQGFAIPGVPEPTTWALMIAGMGAAGYSLRRRPRLA